MSKSTVIVADSTKQVPNEKIARRHSSARFMSYIISRSNSGQNDDCKQAMKKNNQNRDTQQ